MKRITAPLRTFRLLWAALSAAVLTFALISPTAVSVAEPLKVSLEWSDTVDESGDETQNDQTPLPAVVYRPTVSPSIFLGYPAHSDPIYRHLTDTLLRPPRS